MATTLVGQLVLKLVDQASANALGVANALKRVADAARGLDKVGSGAGLKKLADGIKEVNDRAGSANFKPWSLGFEKQIAKLRLSADELRHVRKSWDDLQASFARDKISGALKNIRVAEWRNSMVGSMLGVRAAMDQTGAAAGRLGAKTNGALSGMEKKAKATSASFNKLKNAASVALIGGAGAYGAGFVLRSAVKAPADVKREGFRQKMAGMTDDERGEVKKKSFELHKQYKSALPVEIMEMGRAARGLMGDTKRGNEILPDLVKGLVTLQSTKGLDVAATDMARLVRGIDNLGQNDKGDIGIKQTREIIDGLIKAAQVEGSDFNPGDLYKFARRSKIAGPGLDTDFIFGVAPALMQDQTPEGAGTMLSSAYQSMVVGGKATTSKSNLLEQQRLGLRKDVKIGKGGKIESTGEATDAQTFAKNPFTWVKKNLIPSLKADGINVEDNAAVAAAVSKLSANQNVTGLLTRLVSQVDNIEKTTGLYKTAMGSIAADTASKEDPYIAMQGFTNSLKNLSDAVIGPAMPVIMNGLNGLGDGITKLADALRGSPEIAQSAVALSAGILSIVAALKMASVALGLVKGVMSLATGAAAAGAAGTAAGAAAGAATGVAAGGAAAAGRLASFARLGVPSLAVGGLAYGAGVIGDGNRRLYEGQDPTKSHDQGRKRRRAFNSALGQETSGIRDDANEQDRESSRARALGATTSPKVDTSSLDAAATKATETGDKMKVALNITATPVVDSSSIGAAIQMAERFLSIMNQANAAAMGAGNMRNSFADHGVTP